jgi:hypothetical protein
MCGTLATALYKYCIAHYRDCGYGLKQAHLSKHTGEGEGSRNRNAHGYDSAYSCVLRSERLFRDVCGVAVDAYHPLSASVSPSIPSK